MGEKTEKFSPELLEIDWKAHARLMTASTIGFAGIGAMYRAEAAPILLGGAFGVAYASTLGFMMPIRKLKCDPENFSNSQEDWRRFESCCNQFTTKPEIMRECMKIGYNYHA